MWICNIFFTVSNSVVVLKKKYWSILKSELIIQNFKLFIIKWLPFLSNKMLIFVSNGGCDWGANLEIAGD